MTATIINKKEREKKGLPTLRFSRRGTMYSTPREIITSKKGKKLIDKLSGLNLKHPEEEKERRVPAGFEK